MVTDEQKKTIQRLAEQKVLTVNLDGLIKSHGIDSVDDLNYQQAEKVISHLEFSFSNYDDF